MTEYCGSKRRKKKRNEYVRSRTKRRRRRWRKNKTSNAITSEQENNDHCRNRKAKQAYQMQTITFYYLASTCTIVKLKCTESLFNEWLHNAHQKWRWNERTSKKGRRWPMGLKERTLFMELLPLNNACSLESKKCYNHRYAVITINLCAHMQFHFVVRFLLLPLFNIAWHARCTLLI